MINSTFFLPDPTNLDDAPQVSHAFMMQYTTHTSSMTATTTSTNPPHTPPNPISPTAQEGDSSPATIMCMILDHQCTSQACNIAAQAQRDCDLFATLWAIQLLSYISEDVMKLEAWGEHFPQPPDFISCGQRMNLTPVDRGYLTLLGPQHRQDDAHMF